MTQILGDLASTETEQHIPSRTRRYDNSTESTELVIWQATIMATNMFRLLSRQAFKAVSRPRLGLRLSNGTISHHVRTMQAPYSGPPSYDTIARRFSSDVVDPQAYFIRKRQQEAKDRGEYVDIHDIGGVDPEDFDVLISDVDDEKLRGEIAETVGIPYHAEAAKEDANKVVEIGDCYFYGRKLRAIFPAVVASKKGKAHWVFFIVDTGSPLTYLSA